MLWGPPVKPKTRNLLPFLLLTPLPAFAGAWVQDAGKGLLIVNARHSRSDTFVDHRGQRFPSPDYAKWELNPYAEYGLDALTTVGGSVFLTHVHQDTAGSATGLGDSEWFVRRQLWKQRAFVLSVQPMLALPSPMHGAEPPTIGSDTAAYELRLQGGMSYSVGGMPAYLDLEAGYRHRDGAPDDQWRMEATTGVDVSERWQFIAQANAILPTSDIAAAAGDIDDANDSEQVTAQLSAVYRINARSAAQLGLTRDLHARNTGDGAGVMAAFWYRF